MKIIPFLVMFSDAFLAGSNKSPPRSTSLNLPNVSAAARRAKGGQITF
jgi:hypothetical protein